MKVLILLVTVIFYSSLSFASDVINFPWSGQTYLSTENYFEEVLTLALNKSEDKYGAYIVNKVEAGTSQKHNLRLIQENKFVNLYWTVASKKREQRLLPVRFPLFKGLFGCRISLIKKGQQTRFDQLDNNDQLKLLFAGQGEDWPDSIILRSNQFNLTTSTEDESLF